MLLGLLGAPGNRNKATKAHELSHPENHLRLTQITMRELHAILRALGLEPDSAIEFSENVWDATRAGAEAVLIGTRTTAGKV